LRRLGKVLHLTKRGLTMRAEWIPELGTAVYNGEHKRVGSVLDVFGPVDAPYLAIRPERDHPDLSALVDRELFVPGGKGHGTGKGGKGKGRKA